MPGRWPEDMSRKANCAIGASSVSRFESLPGELRNQIYRIVLLEEEIDVPRTGIVEPALLSVNKKVRKETVSIFYGENKFKLNLPGYDSDILRPWTVFNNRMQRKHNVAMTCALGKVSPPNWPNLRTWLERLHKRTVTPSLYRPTSANVPKTFHLDKKIIGAWSKVIKARRGESWAKVEESLEDLHLILIDIDPRWK